MKRIFLIVLDSCGIGAMPDAAAFGDPGTNTLRACASSEKLHIPNLLQAGLGNIDGVDYLPKTDAPTGASPISVGFCQRSSGLGAIAFMMISAIS